MLKRRHLLAGGVVLAGVGGAGLLYFRSHASQTLGGGQIRHCPFDPVAAENFQQKLFTPIASGPFGVLDVVAPLKIRATAASFPLLPGPASQAPSPFLLYQTEGAGQAYQNVLHHAQRRNTLATSGPYDRIRHPQNVAFGLILVGFLLQWPTLLTLLMFPILLVRYARLAITEVAEMRKRFGTEFEACAERTPRFVLSFRMAPSVA